MSPARSDEQPAVVVCRICGAQHFIDHQHDCDMEPVIRARKAQQKHLPVRFTGAKMREIAEWLTLVCGRHLGIPPDADGIVGRYHYGKGYRWSWTRSFESKAFAVFEQQ
jgi:hypothetical protein